MNNRQNTNRVTLGLVTGGGRGLGRSTVLAMADRGIDSIVTYNENAAAANEVVAMVKDKGRKAVALQLDVGNIASFAAFVEQVRVEVRSLWHRSTIDALVNNGGMAVDAPLQEASEAEFDAAVNMHFKGPFFLSQKLLPLLSDGARIINISTGLARFSMPTRGLYGAAKGALEVMSRYMALELGARGITVNVLAPGAIETDFGGARLRNSPELKQLLGAQTALGRVGVPDDIGPAVAMLLGPEGRWINGQRIEASGGFRL